LKLSKIIRKKKEEEKHLLFLEIEPNYFLIDLNELNFGNPQKIFELN